MHGNSKTTPCGIPFYLQMHRECGILNFLFGMKIFHRIFLAFYKYNTCVSDLLTESQFMNCGAVYELLPMVINVTKVMN